MTLHDSRSWAPLAASLLTLTMICLGPGPAEASVQDLAGRYEGAWTNTTFGSTGKAVIEIQVNGTNAALVFDMDGFVFGYVDPPIITMPGTVVGDQILINNHGVGIFGDISGSLQGADGALAVTLTNVPGGSIQRVKATGSIRGGKIVLNYTVDFAGAPSATNPALGVLGAIAVQPLTIGRPTVEGNTMVFQWTGGNGTYQVQTRTNLTVGTWVSYGGPTANTSARVSIDQGSMGFFRLRSP